MKQTAFKCVICGAFAERVGDCFRHANEPFEDGSGFCDRYGYPIDVVPANPHIGSSLRSLYEELGEAEELDDAGRKKRLEAAINAVRQFVASRDHVSNMRVITNALSGGHEAGVVEEAVRILLSRQQLRLDDFMRLTVAAPYRDHQQARPLAGITKAPNAKVTQVDVDGTGGHLPVRERPGVSGGGAQVAATGAGGHHHRGEVLDEAIASLTMSALSPGDVTVDAGELRVVLGELERLRRIANER